LPSVDLAAFAPFRHAFLIRDPRSLLASYARVRAMPTVDDLGLQQQVWLFEEFGGAVIDSAGGPRAPEGGLRALCSPPRGPFSPALLSGPAGPRASDGVWAPHWYGGVWRSTGFVPATPGPLPDLDPSLEPLLEQCLPYYEKLRKNKIKIDIPNGSG